MMQGYTLSEINVILHISTILIIVIICIAYLFLDIATNPTIPFNASFAFLRFWHPLGQWTATYHGTVQPMEQWRTELS